MNETLEQWIQRLTVAAMVTVAAALVAVGVALYAPMQHPGDRSSMVTR